MTESFLYVYTHRIQRYSCGVMRFATTSQPAPCQETIILPNPSVNPFSTASDPSWRSSVMEVQSYHKNWATNTVGKAIIFKLTFILSQKTLWQPDFTAIDGGSIEMCGVWFRWIQSGVGLCQRFGGEKKRIEVDHSWCLIGRCILLCTTGVDRTWPPKSWCESVLGLNP